MAEDFKISKEEAASIGEALKKPEFRKLLAEYVEEISDPENKKRNEEELIALEKQRGVDMKYIHPKAGFVMKSFLLPEGTRKIFINVCYNDAVAEASSTPGKDSQQQRGEHWSIPYTISPPREDVDKAKNKCTVVDAIFNTKTFQKGKENAYFKKVLVDTVFDGLEGQLHLKVDKERVVFLQMLYKGVPDPAVIRTKIDTAKQQGPAPTIGGVKIPYPPLKEDQEAKSHRTQQKEKKKTKLPLEPKYSIVHRGEFTMQDFTNSRESTLIKRPKELVVRVELPGVESAGRVELDIFEKRITLKVEKPLFKLDLALHYPVDEEKGKAKFDKASKVLTITLPVLPPPPPADAPPQTPLVTPLEADQDEPTSVSAAPRAEGRIGGGAGETQEEEGTEPSPDCPSADGVMLEHSPPVPDSTTATNWLRTGDWLCPPFSYRQEDTMVVFCLRTAQVKENSLVQYFDEHYVQLTYATHTGANYSFHVSFPEGCDLDVDDCSVDISQDNVVLLLRKDLPESDSNMFLLWERFSVGLNASQTTEKLFLTSSNVESVIERVDDFPDPWKRAVWSDSATASVTVSEGGSQLDVNIADSKEAATAGEGRGQQGVERSNPVEEPTTASKEGTRDCKDTVATNDATLGGDGCQLGVKEHVPEETAAACAVGGQVDGEPKANTAASTTAREGAEISNPKGHFTADTELGSTQQAGPHTAEPASNQTKEAVSGAKESPPGDEKCMEPASNQSQRKTPASSTVDASKTTEEENCSPPDTNSNIKLSNKLLYSLD